MFFSLSMFYLSLSLIQPLPLADSLTDHVSIPRLANSFRPMLPNIPFIPPPALTPTSDCQRLMHSVLI